VDPSPDSPAATARSDQGFVFAFQLAGQDLIEAQVEIKLDTAAGRAAVKRLRKSVRSCMGLGAIFTALFAIDVSGILGDRLSALGADLLFFVVALFLWFGAFVLARSRRPRAIRKAALGMVRSVPAAILLRPIEIRVAPQGLRFCGDGLTTEIAWKLLSEVAAGAKFILFVRHDRACYILPRSVVGDAAQQDRLIQTCRDWLTAGGGGAAYARSVLVTGRDQPCPKCSYNLRGTESTVCPECGSPLDPEEMHERVVESMKR
jgi:hypothetical protein